MNRQAGMTLGEVMIVTAVATLVMASAVTATVPLFAREKLRSATYELYSTLQISRVEAVARNRPTRFVLDRDARTLETWDTKGTTTTTDDELIRRATLPDSVSLASPDNEDAVTIPGADSNKYEAIFAANGSAAGSTGSITLHGGGKFTKLNLQAAGGADVEVWDKDEWVRPDGDSLDEINKEALESEWDAARTDYVDDWDKTEETEETKPDDIIIIETPNEETTTDPTTEPETTG